MADVGTGKVLEMELGSDMKKTTEIKGDGRQLIYYDFSETSETSETSDPKESKLNSTKDQDKK